MTPMRADELLAGDRILSPAGHLESVTDVTVDQDGVRVSTNRTGTGYRWFFNGYKKLPVLRLPNAPRPVQVWTSELHPAMCVYVGPSGDHWTSHALAWASRRPGTGAGWEVMDRPGGADRVTEIVADRAMARRRLRRIAAAHAKALGVPVHTPSGGER